MKHDQNEKRQRLEKIREQLVNDSGDLESFKERWFREEWWRDYDEQQMKQSKDE